MTLQTSVVSMYSSHCRTSSMVVKKSLFIMYKLTNNLISYCEHGVYYPIISFPMKSTVSFEEVPTINTSDIE